MSELEAIRALVREKAGIISDINRQIWSYAEGGYAEYRSCEKLVSVLEAEGFSVRRGAAGIETAFIAEYGSGHPVIGITAEYDSLPGLSQQAGEAVKIPVEEGANGHGCGHSALSAGSAGAAVVIAAWLREKGISGTVRLFGTPAEESGFGKVFMAKAGCFDGVDAVFTWHPGDMNAVSFNRMTANLRIRYDFRGVAAHAAAAPDRGRSALDACELMNVGVNYLREHVPSSVRMHYAYLDCGGTAPNVVQDHASLLYIIRAPKLSTVSEVAARVDDVARGAALMSGTEVAIRKQGGMSDVIPNPSLCRVISECMQEAGGPEFTSGDYETAARFMNAIPEETRAKLIRDGAALNGISEEEFEKRPLNTAVRLMDESRRNFVVSASSDVGDLSYLVPTAQFNAAVCIPSTAVHTWQMTAQVGTGIGDRGAAWAALIIAMSCAKVFLDPSIAEKAKSELTEETRGEYVSPLPDDVTPDMFRNI
ncbi:MAG: amidohydrolase [Eubacteriaceae bacterium]|nr:amidohydrolase [Eubacteriaceae bacterium]